MKSTTNLVIRNKRRVKRARIRPYSLSILSSKKNVQFYPDIYDTWGKTITNFSFSSSTYTLTYKVNSVYQFGPQVDFTGAFTSNAPSGLYYLLAGPATAGAAAPYGRFLVSDTDITVRVGSNGTSNNVPFLVGMTLSVTSSLSGQSFTQLPEQKFSTYREVAAYTTTSNSINLSLPLERLFGISRNVFLSETEGYGSTVSSPPTHTAYLHVWFRPVDGSTSGSYAGTVTVNNRYRLNNLNTFVTTVPT